MGDPHGMITLTFSSRHHAEINFYVEDLTHNFILRFHFPRPTWFQLFTLYIYPEQREVGEEEEEEEEEPEMEDEEEGPEMVGESTEMGFEFNGTLTPRAFVG